MLMWMARKDVNEMISKNISLRWLNQKLDSKDLYQAKVYLKGVNKCNANLM